jgi:hypothetical protein
VFFIQPYGAYQKNQAIKEWINDDIPVYFAAFRAGPWVGGADPHHLELAPD